MKILLIQPPIHDFYLTQKRTIPYGLASIAATLKQAGFDIQIFDALATNKTKPLPWPDELMYLDPFFGRADRSPFALFHQYRHFGYSFQHIGKIARDANAFITGISSLFTAYSDQALYTAQVVREWDPKTIIVLGGHHPTHFPREVLAHPAVDYVLRGEGEQSMPEMVKALMNNASVNNIPGIAYKRAENDYVINSPAIVKNLDRLPLPDMTDINQRYYQRSKQKSLTLVASRGCPMKCSYCAIGGSQLTFRKKSVEYIIDEMSAGIGEAQAAFIDFEDENISFDRQWFMALLKSIQKTFSSKLLTLRAMNGLYPNTLDPEMITSMKHAGFNALNLSVATFSKVQLRRFRRPDVSRSLSQIIQTAQTLNLKSTSYLLAGALNQDPFSSVDDLIALFQMGTVAGLSVFYPAPGSADFDFLSQAGMLPKTFSCMRATSIPVTHICTRLQLITLLRLSRIINYIQQLTEQNIPIPKPLPCNQNIFTPDQPKDQMGLLLLSWFLYDGIIRGVDHDYRIYEHQSDQPVVYYFLARFWIDTK